MRFLPRRRDFPEQVNTEIQQENRKTKHEISWKNNTSKNIWRANFWCKTIKHNTKNFEKATGPTNASAETLQKRNMARKHGSANAPAETPQKRIMAQSRKMLDTAVSLPIISIETPSLQRTRQ